MPTTDEQGTPERPVYSYQQQMGLETVFKTASFMVICDEGWRQTVVCSGMYEWAAQWLVEQIQGKPYAPDTRP